MNPGHLRRRVLLARKQFGPRTRLCLLLRYWELFELAGGFIFGQDSLRRAEEMGSVIGLISVYGCPIEVCRPDRSELPAPCHDKLLTYGDMASKLGREGYIVI